MHTPNKVGRASYHTLNQGLSTYTSTLGESDWTDNGGVIFTANQSPLDRHTVKGTVVPSAIAAGAGISQHAFFGVWARMSNLVDEALEQSFGIEFNGWVMGNTPSFYIMPAVLFSAAASIGTQYLSEDTQPVHTGKGENFTATALCYGTFDTKIVIEDPTAMASYPEIYAGVIFVNAGASAVTSLKSIMNFSVRYDFNSVYTYQRGR